MIKIFIPTARSRTITLLRLHRNYKFDNSDSFKFISEQKPHRVDIKFLANL